MLRYYRNPGNVLRESKTSGFYRDHQYVLDEVHVLCYLPARTPAVCAL